MLLSMQVNLSHHSAEIVQDALARGLGRSPEEVVERALETIAQEDPALSDREKNAAGKPSTRCAPLARNTTSRFGPARGLKICSTRATAFEWALCARRIADVDLGFHE